MAKVLEEALLQVRVAKFLLVCREHVSRLFEGVTVSEEWCIQNKETWMWKLPFSTVEQQRNLESRMCDRTDALAVVATLFAIDDKIICRQIKHNVLLSGKPPIK